MVGSWEVVIATLHTDLVHNLVHNYYVDIKPSSSATPNNLKEEVLAGGAD
jgi:hypothetical protein